MGYPNNATSKISRFASLAVCLFLRTFSSPKTANKTRKFSEKIATYQASSVPERQQTSSSYTGGQKSRNSTDRQYLERLYSSNYVFFPYVAGKHNFCPFP